MFLQKLLSLHKGMQVGVGLPRYDIDDRDREKSDLKSVRWFVHVTLVWDGPSVVNYGPSLIASYDFCVSMKLSSTI